MRTALRLPAGLLLALFACASSLQAATLTGEVVDAATGRPIPARVYVRSASGEWAFAQSASPEGSAVRYDRQSGFNKLAIERHTTLSAHPFTADLAPGTYEITVERGKEYRSLSRKVDVASEPVKVRLELERWVDMASRGWFSGDTHVHREPAELPNVMLAEDVNVVHPMVYWTTSDDVAPGASTRNFKGDFPAAPVAVDATHVYYPRNTEYEIFTTRKAQHTLGAVLIVGHKSVFDVPVLPLSRVAARARAEGALLDLEKHNWPWSMPIVPLMNVDLYELSNNHFWRVEYSVKDWADAAPAWMGLSGTGSGNERDWALYGFLNYYALVDCGFRLRPTAGTANGVHPVPLGFGRVYVHVDGDFGYDAWMKALNEGRSFVTTGPMLLCTVDGRMPGERFALGPGETHAAKVEMTSIAPEPVVEIEVVVNGIVARKLKPSASKDARGAFQARATEVVEIKDSSWIAVRSWQETPGGRVRFAHTSPFFLDRPGSPLRPRREEAAFLADRVRGEIARSSKLISPEAVAEYEKALRVFEKIEQTAR